MPGSTCTLRTSRVYVATYQSNNGSDQNVPDRVHFSEHLIRLVDRLRREGGQRSFCGAVGILSVQSIEVWRGRVQRLLTGSGSSCILSHGCLGRQPLAAVNFNKSSTETSRTIDQSINQFTFLIFRTHQRSQ